MTMKHKRPSQAQRVLKYMKDYGGITSLDAMRDLGVVRLASRISELKKNRVAIESEFIQVENRFGEKTTVKRYRVMEGERG